MPHKPGHVADEDVNKQGGNTPAPSPAPAPAPPPASPAGPPAGVVFGPGGSIMGSAGSMAGTTSGPAQSPASPPTTPPLPPGVTLGPGGSLMGATIPSGPNFSAEDMAAGGFNPLITPQPPADSTLGSTDAVDMGAKNFATAFDAISKGKAVKNQFTAPPIVQPPGTMAPMTITGTRVSLVTKPEVPVTEQVQVKVLATGISTGATQEITVIINP